MQGAGTYVVIRRSTSSRVAVGGNTCSRSRCVGTWKCRSVTRSSVGALARPSRFEVMEDVPGQPRMVRVGGRVDEPVRPLARHIEALAAERRDETIDLTAHAGALFKTGAEPAEEHGRGRAGDPRRPRGANGAGIGRSPRIAPIPNEEARPVGTALRVGSGLDLVRGQPPAAGSACISADAHTLREACGSDGTQRRRGSGSRDKLSPITGLAVRKHLTALYSGIFLLSPRGSEICHRI